MKKNFLIFGSRGTIGSSCSEMLGEKGNVYSASHNIETFSSEIRHFPKFDGVIWAQGLNNADSIYDIDESKLDELLQGNLKFIVSSAQLLLKEEKLEMAAQLVVVSSIWGSLARPSKLSYSISKSAILGAIRSIAGDIGPLG